MEVYNCLRKLRTRRGLTQQELADATGVSRQTISAMEKGRYNPSVQVALLAAKALGEPVESVFWLERTRDTEKEPNEESNAWKA